MADNPDSSILHQGGLTTLRRSRDGGRGNPLLVPVYLSNPGANMQLNTLFRNVGNLSWPEDGFCRKGRSIREMRSAIDESEYHLPADAYADELYPVHHHGMITMRLRKLDSERPPRIIRPLEPVIDYQI